MESTENQNDPVLNVEETSAGQSLTEEAGNSNETESSNKTADAVEGQEEKAGEENDELGYFDPKAFMANNEEDDNKSESENNSLDNTDDGDLAWPDLTTNDDSESDNTDNTENKETSEQPVNEEVANNEIPSNEEISKVEVTQEHFKAFTSELGLNAESIDELKEVLNNIVEENNKLSKQLESGNNSVSNKRLDDLNNFLKLDDTDLVRKSLEAEGLKDDKLEYAVERLMDTGLIEVEALKVRNNIDKAIKAESQSIIDKREQEAAKQQESHKEAVESFGNYMQSVDSLFSFKLTGNPDKLPEVRKNHTEYVTSGTYLKEITSSEQTLAESSWLWRNREVLKNALINNGRQNGRKEILDKIGSPDRSNPQRFTSPIDSGEFDPKKFLQG
jgi:hypothetical protein